MIFGPDLTITQRPRYCLRCAMTCRKSAEAVDHTALPFNSEVQRAILNVLGVDCALPCSLSSGLSTLNPNAVACAAYALQGCANFIMDPVEGFVVDHLGRRLGYSAATGPLAEIPGSRWYGKTDGIGWIFGPAAEPLTLQLTGLGGPYYAAVSVLTAGEGRSGVIDEGMLRAGVQRIVPIPIAYSGNGDLTASRAGSGSGTITSDVGVINCPGTCSDTIANGTAITLALTDGLLIIRYLFGLRGASLISGAIAPGATRTTTTAIETKLSSLMT